MKAIYLNLQRIDGFSGYYKKIQSQIKAFKKHGVVIELVDQNCLDKKDLSLSVLSTFKRRKAILDLCEQKIQEINPDFIYVRYPCGDPVYYQFVKKYGHKIVSEHQTLELNEIKTEGKGIRYFMEKIYGKRILKKIRGIVAVTGEIANFQRTRSNRNIPFYIMGNGIEIEKIPFDTKVPPYTDELNLIIVANINQWHGIDRLIKGLAAYNGDKKVRFHVVGGGALLEGLKKTAEELKISDQVIFYGPMRGTELDEVYRNCHVGIGSLALQRLGFTEGAVLKNREYCAKGVPFVYALKDNDFGEKFPYALEVQGTEDPIDVRKIVDFYDEIRNHLDFKEKMRTYASHELSWDYKVKEIIKFIKSLEI